MAEQKVCSDIVSAAMAEEATGVKNNPNMELHREQGESLLLPLLVQQLRYYSNTNQNSEKSIDDSGTESGEDLKLLAVGLQDSIQLQRKSEIEPSREVLGPSLLAEVQSALSRLEASLTLGNSELDTTRKESLLQLVARLQSSLHLPAPPWSKTGPNPSQNQRKFSNKKSRQNRHTVGVSREELADARRLIEETSLKIATCDPSKQKNVTPMKEVVPCSKVTSNPTVAGDLFSTSASYQIPSKSSAFQAFRPVSFMPPRRQSAGSMPMKCDLVPFPFETQKADFTRNSEPPVKVTGNSTVQTQPLDSGFNKEFTNGKISDSIAEKNGSSIPLQINRTLDIIGQVGTNTEPFSANQRGISVFNENQSSQHTLAKLPQKSDSGNSVAEKSLSQSSSMSSKDSMSLDSRRSISQSSSYSGNSSNKDSTPLRFEKPVMSMIKPKRLPLKGNGSVSEPFQKNYAENSSIDTNSNLSLSSPSDSNIQINLKESTLLQPVQDKDSSQHRILNQSISLDNTVTKNQEQVNSFKHMPHSSSLDSSLSNYDPSLLLFTPAQSVQIAVHKAAINKQISIEAEKRSQTNHNESESEVETSDEILSSEESVACDSERDDQEEEESSTLRQVDSINVLGEDSKRKVSEVPDIKKTLAANNTFEHTYFPSSSIEDAKSNTGNSNMYLPSVPIKTGSDIVTNDYSNNRSGRTYHQANEYQYPRANQDMHAFNGGLEKSNNDRNMSMNIIPRENPLERPENLNCKVEEPSRMMWGGSMEKPIKVEEQDFSNKAPWGKNQMSREAVKKPTDSVPVNIQPDRIMSQEPKVTAWNELNDTKFNSGNKYGNSILENIDRNNIDENVSSAQRLLQMATEDPSKPKGQNRKLKMKRANTIDIPKPLNFYQVEADSDSEEETENHSNQSSEHRAAYIALRGPIGVGGKWPNEGKVAPPSLKPKTESDHKFLALLSKGGATTAGESSKVVSYNPSARGGQPWVNRFSNIKTAFESGNTDNKPIRLRSNSGPANARLFWQSADDSVMRKSLTPSANGPKLSRQGSIFLHQLHEQKDLEKTGKLPWADKAQTSEPSKLPWNDKYMKDSVVVGSLTVAKGSASTVQSKKQLFTPASSPVINRPVNINKFSHAPMSAFRPIEKKPTTVSKSLPPSNVQVEAPSNNPWTSPSISGNVKHLASQKFCMSPMENYSNSNAKATSQPKEPKHAEHKFKQDVLSPTSSSLPWTQKTADHCSQPSALDKFKHLSQESSPQLQKAGPPQPPPVLHNASGQPVHIVAPPAVCVPGLKHPLGGTDVTPHRTEVNHIAGEVGDRLSEGSQHPDSGSRMQYLEPLQTYSGSVTSRSSVFPNTGFQYKIPPQAKPELSPRPEPLSPSPPMLVESGPPLNTDNFDTVQRPSFSNEAPKVCSPMLKTYQNLQLPAPGMYEKGLNSPEEMQAVTRVMVGPMSHQAETVSNKTQHCGDEPTSRTSAAQNLSSLLTRFSGDGDHPKRSPQRSPQRSPVLLKPDFGSSDRQSPGISRPDTGYTSHTLQALPDDRKEIHGGHHSSSRYHRSANSGITRNHSEPNITAMIDEDQYFHSQQQLEQNKPVNIAEANSFNNSSSLQQQNNSNMYQHSSYGQYPTNGNPTNSQLSHPLVSMRVRPASTESLITATSTEEFQDTGEAVLTTRLQIPVYSNNVPNSVGRNRDGSHLLSVSPHSFNERKSPSISPSILQKSESWHKLALQQVRGGRPQNPTDLPVKPRNAAGKVQSILPRAKSSHSLATAKQFEAAVTPDKALEKQRAVEAYLSKPSQPKNPPLVQKQTLSSVNSALQMSSHSSNVLLLDESLDNVEKAFDSLFNTAISSPKTKTNLATHASK